MLPRAFASISRGALTAVLLGCAWLPAAELAPEQAQFFEQKIRPVLAEHCYECHSARAEKLKGGLYLDTRAGWQKGGDGGEAVIVPGKPEASSFIHAVRHDDADLAMPPKKPKLPEAVIADLVAWVKMGAPDPRDGAVQTKRADKATWWSLQPLAQPVPPHPPGLPDAWQEHAIDRFIFAGLAQKKLAPNPPADPRSLIRRMTYDLTGLPPTAAEVEAFQREAISNRQSAISNLIERLLASPHYGEHWGRHWLDVVRFGESRGFERNQIIENAWPFRDYVIRSINEDKPFDRFIVEHLAGDVIGKNDPSVEVGTAFLVAGPYDDVGNQDPVAAANIRAATLDDPITATASAFLGLTVNCARCHHHKFDPIPTEDYYRMRAAFEGVKHGERALASAEDRRRLAEAEAPLKKEEQELTAGKTALEKSIAERARAALAGQTYDFSKADPAGTEETFSAPVEARQVRFTMRASTSSPRSAVNARLDEFEVWTAVPAPRNVALASLGAKAEGATARKADDVADAYGPHLAIDGRSGTRWFIGDPAVLTITLPESARIQRVVFANERTGTQKQEGQRGGFPCEYEIEVSLDGATWQRVAQSAHREPFSEAHAIERVRAKITTPEEKTQLAELTRRLAENARALAGVPQLPRVWAGNFAQPNEATRVQKGGDPMKPGEPVAPGSLAVLERVAAPFTLPLDAPEGRRRLALAEWIVSYSNPLTARVLANRVWHYHFGTGLVDTPGDFGFLGSLPTHPELLDHLARRLHLHGWRLKPLHREILLSQAYQQSGAFREDAARADKEARLLWRFPPRRLDAEELRDTLLTVAGRLDPRMRGPGFRLYRYAQDNVSTYFPLDAPGPETYRRAVYHQNARASVVDVLSDFDLPDNAFAAPRRARTTTPLQALTLLNHRFILDLADALAARIAADENAGPPAASAAEVKPAEAIRRAFAFALQRAPTPREMESGSALIAAHGRRAFCRALLNANELLHLE